MKKVIIVFACAFMLAGCTSTKAMNNTGATDPEVALESAAPIKATAAPKPTSTPSATPKSTPEPKKVSEQTNSSEPVSSAKPVKAEEQRNTETPLPQEEQHEEYVYVEPEPEYTEPVWEEPVYYEEPVQETPAYPDGSVAAAYNGQYPGISCEGVAGLYLGGDMSYVLASYGYQVWDPVPGDVIAYFDSGWNYRHTAVFLGNGQALHGSYNADKSAQVASMYIGSYPNLCYYRVGGETCYTQFLNDIAHANGGNAGWLEGITFPLG